MHEALVERARRGDEAAFEVLTRIAGNRSMAVASRILHDREAAERAVEAAFAVAWRTIPRLREPDRFEPWLKALVLDASTREGGTIRRLRSGPGPAEPAYRGPALSDAAFDAIAQRVARTRQLSEQPLFEGRVPLGLALLCAGLAALVVASGSVHPAAGEPRARPGATEASDGAVRAGDVVLVREFQEPLSFTVPRLSDSALDAVLVQRFSGTSIAVISGASLIAIHAERAAPADLCRRRKGPAEDALSSETTFDSWIRRSTGVDVIDSGSFAIDTGTVHWFDITTDKTCRSSFFVGPSERHRLLLVPGGDDRLLVMTGRETPSVDRLSQAAVELTASMRFD